MLPLIKEFIDNYDANLTVDTDRKNIAFRHKFQMFDPPMIVGSKQDYITTGSVKM